MGRRNGQTNAVRRCNVHTHGWPQQKSMVCAGIGQCARTQARHGEGQTKTTRASLAPFDPIVWDRRRFELLWNWRYRFEAYTPAAKRVRGYYALPLLWGDDVIGWGNLSVADNRMQAKIGYVSGKAPQGVAFKHALEDELERMRRFLGVT